MPDHALLDPTVHRDLRIRTERGVDLGDTMMCALVVPDEFRSVQAEYPILFRLDAARENFTALAMFGFENGENLYLEEDRWDARYRPLSIAIQPFLIGRADPTSTNRQVHVDLASPRIASGGEGVRLFDETGRATPYLERIAEQLGALDEGYQASPAFFAALRRHELLEPLTIDVTLDDGARRSLVGYHAIDEDRLRELDSAALGDLHDEGHLMPTFMALASLAQLPGLIARKNGAQRGRG